MRKMAKLFKYRKYPDNSLVAEGMDRVDFCDSYMIKINTNASIEEINKAIFTLPKWILSLLKLRYYLFVKPFGLATGEHEIPVISKNEDEIIVGEDDKHLYFRISTLKKGNGVEKEIFLTTVVKFHNIWGRLYFLPVGQFHKLVCRSLLKKICS